MCASGNGYQELTKLLLDRGADIHRTDTVIYHLKCKLLVACIHFISKDGRAPLHVTSVAGHTAVVGLLIDSGANIAAVDKVSRFGEERISLLLDSNRRMVGWRFITVAHTVMQVQQNSFWTEAPILRLKQRL